MSEVTYGVSELEKIADLGAEMANIVPAIGAANSTVGKFAAGMPIMDEFMGVLAIDADLLKKQAGDVDAEELAGLHDRMAAKFDIEDDVKEAKYEEYLALGMEWLVLIQKTAGVVAKKK